MVVFTHFFLSGTKGLDFKNSQSLTLCNIVNDDAPRKAHNLFTFHASSRWQKRLHFQRQQHRRICKLDLSAVEFDRLR